MKIPIHSATDLITNSSTTIFTYSGGSAPAVKEMITEFFKTFGIQKTFDECFNCVVVAGDDYVYSEYLENLDGEYPEGVDETTDIEQLVKDVQSGKIEKPEWFEEAEEAENYDNYPASTFLCLITKAPEFEKLAKLVKKFLYSTDHEASNG